MKTSDAAIALGPAIGGRDLAAGAAHVPTDHREVLEHLARLGYEALPSAAPVILAALNEGENAVEIAIAIALETLALDVRENAHREDRIAAIAMQASAILYALRDYRDSKRLSAEGWGRSAAFVAALGFANDIQWDWAQGALAEGGLRDRRRAVSRFGGA